MFFTRIASTKCFLLCIVRKTELEITLLAYLINRGVRYFSVKRFLRKDRSDSCSVKSYLRHNFISLQVYESST